MRRKKQNPFFELCFLSVIRQSFYWTTFRQNVHKTAGFFLHESKTSRGRCQISA